MMESKEATPVETLALDGHDSELFSFLSPDQKRVLREHPEAARIIWTFGSTTEEGTFRTCCYWNGAGILVSLEELRTEPIENSSMRRYGAFTMAPGSDAIAVRALTLVRYVFVQAYPVYSLEIGTRIVEPADPQLARLEYLRGYAKSEGGFYSKDDPEFVAMKSSFFEWAKTALDLLSESANYGDEKG